MPATAEENMHPVTARIFATPDSSTSTCTYEVHFNPFAEWLDERSRTHHCCNCHRRQNASFRSFSVSCTGNVSKVHLWIVTCLFSKRT